jgi:hypothetical protein
MATHSNLGDPWMKIIGFLGHISDEKTAICDAASFEGKSCVARPKSAWTGSRYTSWSGPRKRALRSPGWIRRDVHTGTRSGV